MLKYFCVFYLCVLIISAKHRPSRTPAFNFMNEGSSLMKRSLNDTIPYGSTGGKNDHIGEITDRTGALGSVHSRLCKARAKACARACAYGNSYEIDDKEALLNYFPNITEPFLPPVCGLRPPTCDSKTFYRNFDGTCNNLKNPLWGIPNSTYTRLIGPRYSDAKKLRNPRMAFDGGPLPCARTVRTTLFPAGSEANELLNINAMTFGQFIAHDMSLIKTPDHPIKCCTPDGHYRTKTGRFCFPIKISPDDPMGKANITCMNFTRTFTDRDMGVGKRGVPASQINTVTDYLDLSPIYGLGRKMNDELRTFVGGQMKTEERNGHIFLPTEKNKHVHCRFSLDNEHVCYKSGDSRANQNPQLVILQTLFVREHNRIASELHKLNHCWKDEIIFQEARRILIAMYQRIVYYEWLPKFLGRENLLSKHVISNATGHVNDYNHLINPGVLNEHAQAAFRYFHTNIVGIFNFLDNMRQKVGTYKLSEVFNRPEILETDKNNMEQLTMGMVAQNFEDTDTIHVDDIVNKLFAGKKEFGIDLRATDIQRERDHGVCPFYEYKNYFGFRNTTHFDNFTEFISPANVDKLKTLYKDYRDVDLSVGGSLERHARGAEVGPTFLAIMSEQFLRTRQADRFFFEHKEAGFSHAQLEEIRKASISRLFCDCGDGIKQMQLDGFSLTSETEFLPCALIPKLDLTPWKVTEKPKTHQKY